jgi:serine/threonine protein kinase
MNRVDERYQIVRLIGSSGMGAVYEARDLQRDIAVALKQVCVSQRPAAFARAARQLADLSHPVLPRIDGGVITGDQQFVVMEYIDGTDLDQLLAQGFTFPIDDVLAWADQLLDALAYLHSRTPAVIHRDIKPHNLKLTGRGRVVLLDIGVARGGGWPALRPRAADGAARRQPYAAPEQAAGRAEARSDLYGLAATLYHLLAGVPPADAATRATLIDGGLPDLLRPLHQVRADLPAAVSEVIHSALALAPCERPSARVRCKRRCAARGG